jgi:tRNA G18 (ribose-2'-O)-methylase SpoU
MLQVDYAGPVAILIGGEGTGLPASVLAGADERVTVPMQPPVESLNAAVTTALIVYEAFRQRSARSVSD